MAASIDTSPCTVPRWLPGGHSQTLYGALFTPYKRVAFSRERIDTPDGDFIDFDWQGLSLPINSRQVAREPCCCYTDSKAVARAAMRNQ